MSNNEFLENGNLYQKYYLDVPDTITSIKNPSVHMYCQVCESEQTFNFQTQNWAYNSGHHPANVSSSGQILFLNYLCTGCHCFRRVFVIKISEECDYVLKVGQYPEIDISIDKELLKTMGEYSALYKRGLICEAQGYGIGAYAYYRRIVELIIDDLIDNIYELIDDEKKEDYERALQKTKETQNTSEKIKLIKDLLPSSLRPDNMNPLGILYGLLSEGIHNKSDDECIDIAQEIQNIIVFLIKHIIRSKDEKKEFTESMKKILKKKAKHK